MEREALMSPRAHTTPPPALERPVVALVGPRPTSRGGVAATVRAIADAAELCATYRLVVVATMCDGSSLAKGRQAVVGLAQLARLLARGGVAIVHLHSSDGVSYLR